MKQNNSVLRTVTDRFSLWNDGRRVGANKRNYVIKSVKDMLNSDHTKELLRLKEALGFYGHKPRERAGKLYIGESEVININGHPVVVDNVPASRTVNVSLDEKTGIVTQTEEILDTPTGRIVDSLIGSGDSCCAGGWSWATSGRDTAQASYTKNFAGFDYVLQPNFLSLNHPTMMTESIDRNALMLEALQSAGVSIDDADRMIEMGNSAVYLSEQCASFEQREMILEGMISELNDRIVNSDNQLTISENKIPALLDVMDNSLPVFITDDQRSAMLRLATDNDKMIVKSMFESIAGINISGLPINHQNESKNVVKQSIKPKNMVSFGGSNLFK